MRCFLEIQFADMTHYVRTRHISSVPLCNNNILHHTSQQHIPPSHPSTTSSISLYTSQHPSSHVTTTYSITPFNNISPLHLATSFITCHNNISHRTLQQHLPSVFTPRNILHHTSQHIPSHPSTTYPTTVFTPRNIFHHTSQQHIPSHPSTTSSIKVFTPRNILHHTSQQHIPSHPSTTSSIKVFTPRNILHHTSQQHIPSHPSTTSSITVFTHRNILHHTSQQHIPSHPSTTSSITVFTPRNILHHTSQQHIPSHPSTTYPITVFTTRNILHHISQHLPLHPAHTKHKYTDNFRYSRIRILPKLVGSSRACTFQNLGTHCKNWGSTERAFQQNFCCLSVPNVVST